MREMRALCSHQFEAILLGDFEPDQVDIMVDEAAAANFNAIQLCVRAPGILYYPSEHGPVHESCREYDLLGEVVDKAHRAGLEVHSYFPIFLEGGWRGREYAFDAEGGMFAEHKDWRVLAYEEGELVPTCFACPSNEDYVDYVDQLSPSSAPATSWTYLSWILSASISAVSATAAKQVTGSFSARNCTMKTCSTAISMFLPTCRGSWKSSIAAR